MRLIIHPGTHKTGTTSIQKALYDNRPFLRENGLFVPSFSPFTGDRAHLNLSHSIADDTEASRMKVKRFVENIHSNAKDAETVIISSEAFYRHVLGTRELQVMISPDYNEMRKRYVEKLSRIFEGFEVEVHLYFRDYGYFLAWLQRTLERANVWSGTAEEFKAKFSEHFSYEKQISIFFSSFPRISLYSYEEAKSSGLISSFFRSIGFPTPPGAEDLWERPTRKPIVPI